MNLPEELRTAWNPFLDSIQKALRELAEAPIPEECDFLWFVLHPQELEGLPVTVWPTEKDQQQYDGWEREYDLWKSVPDHIKLPEDAGASVEALDALRDATADFLHKQWNVIDPSPDRLAYFSIYDDGFYFSMRDGRRISAWDISHEIDEQLSRKKQ